MASIRVNILEIEGIRQSTVHCCFQVQLISKFYIYSCLNNPFYDLQHTLWQKRLNVALICL